MSNDQWALVTGASGGIGREFVLILSLKGKNVILASRNAARLAGLKEEIERTGKGKAEVIQADLASPGGASQLYEECRKRGLSVDTLVNNAGSGIFGRSVDIPQSEAEAMLFLNIQGLTSLCGLFGKDMEKRGSGMILNVGSIAGNQPTPYFASYAASKSYVLMYSLALREELKGSGVRVTCLEPGYVRTDFDENAKVASDRYKDFSRNHSMPAERVAAVGIRAMERGKAVAIAGFSNRIAAFFSSLVPRKALARVLRTTVERMTR